LIADAPSGGLYADRHTSVVPTATVTCRAATIAGRAARKHEAQLRFAELQRDFAACKREMQKRISQLEAAQSGASPSLPSASDLSLASTGSCHTPTNGQGLAKPSMDGSSSSSSRRASSCGMAASGLADRQPQGCAEPAESSLQEQNRQLREELEELRAQHSQVCT
jgi:hypothetical protein